MGEDLPVVRDEPSTVEQWRAELARRDGFLSPSNAAVPKRATDVGGPRRDPNPTAKMLGYEASTVEVDEFAGLTYLRDGSMGTTAEIGIDSDNFIEDVSDWA